MKINQKNKLAFSLIELSVVILVIGILVIGITQGSRIMRSAKVSSANSLTKSSPVNSIDGLVLWLDANSKENIAVGTAGSGVYGNPADGNNITNWRDINTQSSTKITVSAVADSNRPTYQELGINGLPSLKFDGGLQFLESTAAVPLPAGDNAFTFIFVWTVAATGLTDTQVLFGQGPSTFIAAQHAGVILTNNPLFGFFGAGNDYYPIARSTLKAGQNHITTMSVNGVANNITIFQDSNNDATYRSNTAGTGAAGISVGTASFRVGTSSNDTGGQFNFNGLVSEIIIFNRPLKTLEITTIQNYLSAKYNIKLS